MCLRCKRVVMLLLSAWLYAFVINRMQLTHYVGGKKDRKIDALCDINTEVWVKRGVITQRRSFQNTISSNKDTSFNKCPS